jgi:hypothetical protein
MIKYFEFFQGKVENLKVWVIDLMGLSKPYMLCS